MKFLVEQVCLFRFDVSPFVKEQQFRLALLEATSEGNHYALKYLLENTHFHQLCCAIEDIYLAKNKNHVRTLKANPWQVS